MHWTDKNLIRYMNSYCDLPQDDGICLLQCTRDLREYDCDLIKTKNNPWVFVKNKYSELEFCPDIIKKCKLSLINSMLYQQRKAFCISYEGFSKIIENDKNWHKPLKSSYILYNNFIEHLLKDVNYEKKCSKNGFEVFLLKNNMLLNMIEIAHKEWQEFTCLIAIGIINPFANMRQKAFKKASVKLSKEEKQEIKNIYEKCREISKNTGIKHHVDHIIPVSKGGLHHPNNLQILTAKENLEKGAKLNYGKSSFKA